VGVNIATADLKFTAQKYETHSGFYSSQRKLHRSVCRFTSNDPSVCMEFKSHSQNYNDCNILLFLTSVEQSSDQSLAHFLVNLLSRKAWYTYNYLCGKIWLNLIV